MARTPNLVFVFSDQHRRSALSLWQREEYRSHLLGEGDPVYTPNLDKLADEGVLLSDAYSSYPVCSPFRAMLFSGLYPENNGVWQNCAPGRSDELRKDIPTFTDILSDAGYSVGYVGKWHLEEPRADFDETGNYIGDVEGFSGERFFSDGTKDPKKAEWDTLIPKDRQRKIDYLYAYNTFDVFRKTADMNFHTSPHYWDKELNKVLPPEEVWTPDFETELALNFLRNEHSERDESKPFALFVSFNPPHTPCGSRGDTDHGSYDEMFSKAAVDDYRELLNRKNVDMAGDDFEARVRVYFSHVGGIDKCVGRLMDSLSSLGLEKDTVFIFTSDHGEMLGSHGLVAKNVPYEEATAIPFIIRYPQKLHHRTEELMFDGCDIMPTVLNLMGIKQPESLDGRDFSSILHSGVGDRPESVLFTQVKRKGVRTKKYLMTISYGDEERYCDPLLFSLADDPYQLKPIPFESIGEEELQFLRRELGMHLARSSDPWYKRRLYSDFIIYPC